MVTHLENIRRFLKFVKFCNFQFLCYVDVIIRLKLNTQTPSVCSCIDFPFDIW